MFCGMNRKLAATAAKRGGWFTRLDAISAGYSDPELRSRVAEGRWLRLCRGAYAEVAAAGSVAPLEQLAPWEQAVWRHARTAKAVYHRLGGRAVVSHQSALLLHGVEVSELDLTRVHVTRVTGPGRSDGAVCQHAARPAIADPAEIDRVKVSPGPRSVVEAARSASYPVAVSVVDAALRQGLATIAELTDALELFENRAGTRAAARAIAFGSGLAESVGESRLRILLADLGLPAPVLQAEIRDADGRLIGRVDFLFVRWGLVVEFDGKVKYASEGREALVAEKVREDRLRELGYQVVRVTWNDLDAPAGLLVRLKRAIERASRTGLITGSVTAGML